MDSKENKRKRRSTAKPDCKYGAACYQKNPDHRKKFKHPNGLEKNDISNKDCSVSLNSKETVAAEITESNRDADKSIVKEVPLLVSDANLTTLKKGETAQQILKNMPKDFFDFWEFCSTVNELKPEEAFSELGFHLVGLYDILSKKLPGDKVIPHCHWRYYYDPPEFQTVVKQDGDKLYHIGYFRDDPSELPPIVVANSAAVGPKLALMGDNIFAAVKNELNKATKKQTEKSLVSKFSKILDDLEAFAKTKKYSLETQTAKTKARQKQVVAKTFHGLGIAVPFKNDIGYRPLPDSDSDLKAILKKIVTAKDENKRLEHEESLDEIITNVQFANDECDYGMGLELGIDLFCYGDPYLHPHILSILPVAYDLLKRPKYGEIIRAHLADRKKGDDLSHVDA